MQLILVHSPLVGPATWELVAPLLAGRGYDVVIPDLTSTLASGPPYFSRQAEVIAASVSGRPAALAGHSGAGPLLMAAGAALDRVEGYVFVDAGLPCPARSWMGTAPAELAAQVRAMADKQGWLPPWPQWWEPAEIATLIPDPERRKRFTDGCLRLPLAMFTEIHPDAPRWREAPAAYVRLSEPYDEPAGQARALGWPVIERDSDHLAPVTRPRLVADAIMEALGQISPGSRTGST